MPILLLRCPNTGGEVSTGLNVDAHTFADLPDKLVTSNCPLCEEDHTWLKCDARYVETKIPVCKELARLLRKLD